MKRLPVPREDVLYVELGPRAADWLRLSSHPDRRRRRKPWRVLRRKLEP
jgi:hypothetical protein